MFNYYLPFPLQESRMATQTMTPVSSLRSFASPSGPQTTPHASMSPVPSGGSFDSLSMVIATLNTNPYLIGMLMLLLNLGGRFLPLELTKKQEAFLQQPWLRPVLFLTVIFISTRNLAVAFWITLFFFLIVWVLANEKSPYCLIPSWKEEVVKQSPYDANMTLIEQLTYFSQKI